VEDVKIFFGANISGTSFYVFTFSRGEFHEAPPWLAASEKILKL
jgi:hypothetical protein